MRWPSGLFVGFRVEVWVRVLAGIVVLCSWARCMKAGSHVRRKRKHKYGWTIITETYASTRNRKVLIFLHLRYGSSHILYACACIIRVNYFTQEYKWAMANCQGNLTKFWGYLRWISILSRKGGCNTPSHLKPHVSYADILVANNTIFPF